MMMISVSEMVELQKQLSHEYDRESFELIKRLHQALIALSENLRNEDVDEILSLEDLQLCELMENTNQYLEVYG